MISKQEAYTLAKKYLGEKKPGYTFLVEADKISFHDDRKIPFGSRKGEVLSVYSISYEIEWGNEEKTMGLYLDAETGEVLYIITPTGYYLH